MRRSQIARLRIVIRHLDSAVVRALEARQSLLRYIGTGVAEPYGVIGLVPGAVGSTVYPRRPTGLPHTPEEGRLHIRVCSYESCISLQSQATN